MSDSVSATELRRAAMDLLARREHSRQELHDKLRRRFGEASVDAIGAQLEQLAAEGLQSDARFAESFVHSRGQRLYGPRRIAAELNQRGIDSALVNRALDEAAINWHDSLLQLSRNKYGARPPADYAERQKRGRFFQYRGFTAEQIGQLFAAAEAAEFD